jgi:16S rRNA (cytosine1407-C5)-methyltransferase
MKNKAVSSEELFKERLSQIFPEDIKDTIIKNIHNTRLPAIRINTLKTNQSEVSAYLESKNIKAIPIPWFKEAFIIDNADSRQLTDLEIYQTGFFYIQSLSSMAPALVLDPQPGEKILDMAAAPGSKTTQLAAMMNNTGEITANDPSRERIFKLQQNLALMGVTNAKITSFDGQSLWHTFPEYFDKTLVDVPCSMEGTITQKNYGDFFGGKKYWSPKKIKQLSKMQKWLLRSAVSATKPGGTIVYSTCTLSPEENEENIDWILEKEKKSVEIEEMSLPDLERYPAITEYKDTQFNPEVSKTLRILPTATMEGFFVAKLRKKTSNIPSTHI